MAGYYTCTQCREPLESAFIDEATVYYCVGCRSLFLPARELDKTGWRDAPSLEGIARYLWNDAGRLRIVRDRRHCPVCFLPMLETRYAEAAVPKSDDTICTSVCRICEGVWIGDADIKALLAYAKELPGWNSLHAYVTTRRARQWEPVADAGDIPWTITDVYALLSIAVWCLPHRRQRR